jgi:hypothetical protein
MDKVDAMEAAREKQGLPKMPDALRRHEEVGNFIQEMAKDMDKAGIEIDSPKLEGSNLQSWLRKLYDHFSKLIQKILGGNKLTPKEMLNLAFQSAVRGLEGTRELNDKSHFGGEVPKAYRDAGKTKEDTPAGRL